MFFLLRIEMGEFIITNNNFLNVKNLQCFKDMFPGIISFIYNDICEVLLPLLTCLPLFSQKHFKDNPIIALKGVYFDNLLNICH